ncbi:MAG: AraC family transcriptional regulator [Bacteroidales bacterium]|nr:AraC family transcriptional regulator [Bacteroidales bacterium]
MKIAKIRLLQDPNKSFIVHNEKSPFAPWHHHPEYELVLILKGRGQRLVGDHIDRFEEKDLIFIGPYLPHQWICDNENSENKDSPNNEAFVIQFVHNALGDKFFEIPENVSLKKFLCGSIRGYEFYGKSKDKIISILLKMIKMNDVKRLYTLFSIFEIFASSNEYHLLSSPASVESFLSKENEPMQKSLQYIMQNFQKKIQIKDLLKVADMPYSTFYSSFKHAYTLPFKDYLLNIRIGYACKLLIDETQDISQIAFDCGFENLSNFNRQFKRIKNLTPSQYQKKIFCERNLQEKQKR